MAYCSYLLDQGYEVAYCENPPGDYSCELAQRYDDDEFCSWGDTLYLPSSSSSNW